MIFNWTSFLTALAFLLASAATGVAQHEHEHSDVRFRYEAGRIVVDPGPEGWVFEGHFEVEGIDRQFTTSPGFNSEIEDGRGIGANDTIVYNVLDHLMYWNGDFQTAPGEAWIRIENNPSAPVVPETMVSATTGVQPGSFDPFRNRIGSAEASGGFHTHVDFYLEPNAAPEPAPESWFGAYGIKMSLSTDAPSIADSDPFFVVFNFGLDEEVFEDAVLAYAALVPEPSTASLLAIGALLLCARRRAARDRSR